MYVPGPGNALGAFDPNVRYRFTPTSPIFMSMFRVIGSNRGVYKYMWGANGITSTRIKRNIDGLFVYDQSLMIPFITYSLFNRFWITNNMTNITG